MPSILRAIIYRLRSWFARDARTAELERELATHRALIEDELRQAGQTDDEAARLATLRLGNATAIRERTRALWSLGWLEAVAQDARYALRFLRRSPVFTVVAVVSLALGVGANAAVLAVVDRLLFRGPPAVAEAHRLYAVNVRRDRDAEHPRPFSAAMRFPEILAIRESARSFAAVALFTPPERRRLGHGPEAPRIKESMVSVDFFDVLGVRPAAGRLFIPDDDREAQASRAAVISWRFWQQQFAGADSALGAHLVTTGLDFVIVGVAPPDFTGVTIDAPDVWVTVGAAAPTRIGRDWRNWSGYGIRGLVRLRDGVTPAAANAEASVILNRLPVGKREPKQEKIVAIGSVLPGLGPAEQPAEVKVSTRLAIASTLVLLAACANLANLLLVRALSRRREIALRLAVGISRRRLVGQLALESFFIAIAGALAALLVARWGGTALRRLVFPETQWASGAVDLRVMVFALGAGLLVAALATIAPAIRMTRSDVAQALRSSAPQITASTGRFRQGLLVLQVALAVLLIVGAAAFGRSLMRAYRFDMGVDLDRIVLTRLFVEDSIDASGRRAMLEDALRRARSMPQVERVTLASRVPLVGNSVMRVSVPGGDPASPRFSVVWDITPELQSTLGLRLVRGRWITPAEVRGGAPLALVTETMARTMWARHDPIGSCARFGTDTAPCLSVVGIVRDLRTRSIREEAPQAALRVSADVDLSSELGAYLVIRTEDPSALVPKLKVAFRDIRPDLTSIEVRPLLEALEYDYRPLRLGSIMFLSFSLLTVLLAAVGLYGILAFGAAQRTGELGVRAALGARAADLARLVMGEGLALVSLGFVLGGLVSWLAAKAIEALLFDASARSALPYAIAAIVLGVAATGASAVPAWRAARVDPARALRAE